jgi:hypothetical protein
MQLYIAEVLDNNDLEMKGRVQIYCAPIHHNIKAKNSSLLPWAQSASCFTSMIPAVGEFWWVFFEKEEHYKNPFYMAPVNFSGLHGHNKTIGSMTAVYPNVKYLRLPNDVAIALSADTATPEISIHHPKAEIYIDKDGHITITSSNGDNTIVADASGIVITDANGNTVTCDSTGITLSGGNKLVVNGTPTPAASGPFNCLGNCLFTGGNHSASEVVGI